MNGDRVSAWKVHNESGDVVFDSETVNVAVSIAAGEIYGNDTWASVDPRTGPKALGAWVALAIAKEKSISLEEAQRYVVQLPLIQLMSMLEVPDGTRL